MKFDPAEWRTRTRDLAQKALAPFAAFFSRKEVRAAIDWLVAVILVLEIAAGVDFHH